VPLVNFDVNNGFSGEVNQVEWSAHFWSAEWLIIGLHFELKQGGLLLSTKGYQMGIRLVSDGYRVGIRWVSDDAQVEIYPAVSYSK
jgi:hypothetical protein